jgi:hypothetical protein
MAGPDFPSGDGFYDGTTGNYLGPGVWDPGSQTWVAGWPSAQAGGASSTPSADASTSDIVEVGVETAALGLLGFAFGGPLGALVGGGLALTFGLVNSPSSSRAGGWLGQFGLPADASGGGSSGTPSWLWIILGIVALLVVGVVLLKLV